MQDRVSQLQENLGPTGTVHQNRDYAKLKQLVQDAIDYVRKSSCADQLKEDLHLVEKGIIKPIYQLPKEKPALNVHQHFSGFGCALVALVGLRASGQSFYSRTFHRT